MTEFYSGFCLNKFSYYEDGDSNFPRNVAANISIYTAEPQGRSSYRLAHLLVDGHCIDFINVEKRADFHLGISLQPDVMITVGQLETVTTVQ
jgi:hypothetical protein